MIGHKLAVEHIRKQKKMIMLTIGLLIVAFLENYYLSCVKDYSPLQCGMSWIFVFLAGVVVYVLWWYRK